MNSPGSEALINKITATTDDLIKLGHRRKSSLLGLGASQWLLSDILSHWEHAEQNDHQIIVKNLRPT